MPENDREGSWDDGLDIFLDTRKILNSRQSS